MKFIEIALNYKLQKALKDLDYKEATQVQELTIPPILKGKDVMARAKTGTGKTAAFALPILNNLIDNEEPRYISALILAPTRELVQQIHNSFVNYGKYTDIKVEAVYGGVSINPQIKCVKQGLNILIATPGRLLDLANNHQLNLERVNTLILDEADRMLDLGFKAELDQVFERIPTLKQTLLFSATFDDEIYKFSKSHLSNPEAITVDEKNQTADNVEQTVYTLDSDRKREFISYLIGSKNWQQVLIFTRTKKMADSLAKEMCKDGIKTQSLHGDKSQGARDKALSDFKSGQIRALVATDVAARGIDINDLGHVINFELPYVAEDYVHRIGRTGRAGKVGVAISLMAPEEEWLLIAIEKLLDIRLLQQWFPGYEPDLTKSIKPKRTVGKNKERKKALSNNKEGARRNKNRR